MATDRGEAADRTRDRSRLLVATRSEHKLRELRELLGPLTTELVSLDDIALPGDAIEDGDSFAANAAKKARFFAALSGLPTLADDSGLEVDALKGGPGVRTRRYACLLYTSPSPRDGLLSRMPSSA